MKKLIILSQILLFAEIGRASCRERVSEAEIGRAHV